MRKQIKHNQFWTALILAFFVLAFSGQKILAQKKKNTSSKRITSVKSTNEESQKNLTDSSCSKERSSRSTESVKATNFSLVNQTKDTLIVYWLDFEGNRQKWFEVSSGATAKQDTFMTHSWVVTKPNGQCLRIFTAPGEFVIDEPQNPQQNVAQSQQSNSVPSDTESSATLKETTDWLIGAIPKFGNFNYLGLDNHYYGVDTWATDKINCNLEYTFGVWKSEETGNSNSPKITDKDPIGLMAEYRDTFTIPFGSLDVLGLKVYKYNKFDFFVVEVNSSGLKKTISQSRLFWWKPTEVSNSHPAGKRPPTETEAGPFKATVSTTYFYVRDEESANRIAKAIKHAAKLCGGKVDPF